MYGALPANHSMRTGCYQWRDARAYTPGVLSTRGGEKERRAPSLCATATEPTWRRQLRHVTLGQPTGGCMVSQEAISQNDTRGSALIIVF